MKTYLYDSRRLAAWRKRFHTTLSPVQRSRSSVRYVLSVFFQSNQLYVSILCVARVKFATSAFHQPPASHRKVFVSAVHVRRSFPFTRAFSGWNHVSGRRGEHQEAHRELQKNPHRADRTVESEWNDGTAQGPRDVRRGGGLQPVQVSVSFGQGVRTAH